MMGESKRTRQLDDALWNASRDQTAYRRWCAATCVWFLIVFCGGIGSMIWLAIGSSGPGGFDYSSVVIPCVIVLTGGGLLGTAFCVAKAGEYWVKYEKRRISPHRNVQRLARLFTQSREDDLNDYAAEQLKGNDS